jgi:hypothetical protein
MDTQNKVSKMTTKLKETIKICDQIFSNCDIDYDELKSKTIDSHFFEEYQNTRIINSFLFNFSKLQDKIGAKLFKQLLIELREIDNDSVVMIDVLNILEKFDILQRDDWERLREIRNSIAHEYPYNIQERVENIYLALDGYKTLKQIYTKTKGRL